MSARPPAPRGPRSRIVPDGVSSRLPDSRCQTDRVDRDPTALLGGAAGSEVAPTAAAMLATDGPWGADWSGPRR